MAQSREHIHVPQNVGAKVADMTVASIGTWRFIIVQGIILALWIMLNSVAWFYHWDPAPFILLNLCLSFQAAFTGPIVLLSQNRQASRDRKRDDLEAQEVQALFESHELLMTINQQQLEILQLLREEKPARRPIRKAVKDAR